jgi:hypothetical protein
MSMLSGDELVSIIAAAYTGTCTNVRFNRREVDALIQEASASSAVPHRIAATLAVGVLRGNLFAAEDLGSEQDPNGLTRLGFLAAFEVGSRQLAFEGFRLPAASIEDESFALLGEAVTSGAANVADVEAWLRDRTDSATQPGDGQLSLNFASNVSPSPIRAYVASALTGLNDQEHAALVDCSEVIKGILAEDGIHVHCPTDYTDPRDTGHDPPSRAARIDYAAILRSDLIVYVANRPSTGVGKELVWAERNGCVTLLIGDPSSTPSRLVTGTTGRLTEIAASLAPDALASEIKRAIAENRTVLEAHARERGSRARRYWERLDRFLNVLPQVEESLAGDSTRGLTLARAREIVSSVDHLANASLIEIDAFAEMAGVTAEALQYGREPHDLATLAIGTRELHALRSAADLEGWTPDDVIELLVSVTRESADSGVAYRRSLREAKGWIDHHEGR